MSDKLEALSQPVAFDYQIAGACIADGNNENGKWVHWRNELSREFPPEWMIEEGKVKELKRRYSQEYVTALREDAARWFKAFEKAVSAGARYEERIDELLATLEEANKQLSGEELVSDMTRDSAKYWKKRAEAAEQREEHLKADVAVLAQRNKDLESDVLVADGIIANHQKLNVDLEQRLQQPITVEWQYPHWNDDEWSAAVGILKYKNGDFCLVEIDGKPTVINGVKLRPAVKVVMNASPPFESGEGFGR